MPPRPPTPAELAFLQDRRIAHLATTSPDGVTTIHPFCYAVIDQSGGPAIVTALDEKPKQVDVRELGRVRDISINPEVAIVADDYSEVWSRLAWVHLRGQASLLEPDAPGHESAVVALRTKYPQYAQMAIDTRPIIRIDGLTARSWHGGNTEAPLPRPNDLPTLIRGRRSVRGFSDQPVPRAIVEDAIAAAGWAPSPHGRQPWRFAVLESPERRHALADAMAATWREQLELDGEPEEVVLHRLDRSRDRLVTAPILVLVCLYLDDLDTYPDPDRQAAETTMAIQSLGAAVQNFLLTIYASGLDSGWMCAPLFCPEIVRDALGLSSSLIPHALLPVGYAAKDPIRRPRRPLEELIVSWE